MEFPQQLESAQIALFVFNKLDTSKPLVFRAKKDLLAVAPPEDYPKPCGLDNRAWDLEQGRVIRFIFTCNKRSSHDYA
jgi:hypothetical protein